MFNLLLRDKNRQSRNALRRPKNDIVIHIYIYIKNVPIKRPI